MIEWGDGSTTTVNSGFDNISENHTYNNAGSYTINVSATDNDGATASESFSVTVVKN